MITYRTVITCDYCGKQDQTEHAMKSNCFNFPDTQHIYERDGWKVIGGANDNFTACPECVKARKIKEIRADAKKSFQEREEKRRAGRFREE